ncbi:hypothetical protein AADZ90_016625 [Aestuariibius sp. 2305UL40-4]|uniref:hypothetical protein n=1 Tax=Aestuariibius violaceus TaxID=3234132 RepID=UPI00345EC5C8
MVKVDKIEETGGERRDVVIRYLPRAGADLALHATPTERSYIHNALSFSPHGRKDITDGSFRVRRIGLLDVVFALSEEAERTLVVVHAVRPYEPPDFRDRLRRTLEWIRLVRGAAGL